MRHTPEYWLTLTMLLLALACGFLFGIAMQERKDHNAAIGCGVARYVVDPLTGQVAFRYLGAVQEARK